MFVKAGSIHIATQLLDFRARTGRVKEYPESLLHAAHFHRMHEALMSSRVGNMGYIFFSWLCHISGSVNTGKLLGLNFPIYKVGIMNAVTSLAPKKYYLQSTESMA